MNVGRGNTEVFRCRIQFVCRIRQLRQRLRKPRAIDTGALPEISVCGRRHAASRGLDRAGRGSGTFVSGVIEHRVEHRIAKADHRNIYRPG